MYPIGVTPSQPLLWQGPGRFVPAGPAGPSAGPPPQAADSWLVDEGRCRGMDEHRARFVGSCDRPTSQTTRFMDDVLAALPRRGRWFPRVDCTDGELTYWLRPAPPLLDEVAMGLPGVVDPRVRPAVKGPDLAVLGELRRQAGHVGAGEALLVSRHGEVLEGALSSLLWWRDEVLCCPPEGPGLLPGVTRRLLLRLAAAQAQPVRFETVAPADLDGLEVWSVSALHGIRAVVGWHGPGDGGPTMHAGPARHAAAWQTALLALAEPLP